MQNGPGTPMRPEAVPTHVSRQTPHAKRLTPNGLTHFLGYFCTSAGSRGGAEARTYADRASTSAISRGQFVISSTPFGVEKYSSSMRAPKPAYFARAAAVLARNAALFVPSPTILSMLRRTYAPISIMNTVPGRGS